MRPAALLAVALGAGLPTGDGALAVYRDGKWVEWYDAARAPIASPWAMRPARATRA